MNAYISSLFIVLLVHWLADFALQTHEQAQNKGKNIKALGWHVATYTVCMIAVFSALGGWVGVAIGVATGITHFGIDFVSSKASSKLYSESRFHDFFVVIGFDQLLHVYLLIIGTACIVEYRNIE